jgi:phage tail-like protein
MARSIRTDHVQNYRFRAIIMDGGSQPGLAILASAATSLLGGAFGSFSKISVPGVSVTTQDIQEGVWPFTRKVITSASLEEVTLERGVTVLDSSFWQWAIGAITGDIARKTVMIELLHRAQEPALFPGPQQDRLKAATLTGTLTIGKADYVTATIRPAIPIVAKRWVLHDCIPIRVKPASDLDATSGEVSLAELVIHANYMQQFPFTGG